MECKTINKANLFHNVEQYKDAFESLKQNSKILSIPKICAVVKANAYGHGDIKICEIIKNSVDCFAVANVKEGKRLKKHFQHKSILILGKLYELELKKAIFNDLEISISSLSEIKTINNFCKKNKKIAKIHICINTGMNRLGIKKLNELKYLLEFLKDNDYIQVVGVWTHFYNSISKNMIKKQLIIFKKNVNQIKKCFPNVIVHASNSNAFLTFPPCTFDMVRVGIGLYGYCVPALNLKPVLFFKVPIIATQNVKKGEQVSYGDYVAPKDMKIAVLGVGYADGISRNIANQGYVLVQGEKAKIVGNICMDMFMIDITDIEICENCHATIIGKNGDREISATQIAQWTNTIEYEVLTNLNSCRR